MKYHVNRTSTKTKYKILRSIEVRGIGREETFKNNVKKWSVIQERRVFQKLDISMSTFPLLPCI